MKKILLLLIIVGLFSSCKKETKDSETNTTETFIINGVHEVHFENELSNLLSLSVDLPDGATQETVNLSVEGLPSHVKTSFSASSGIPKFTSLLTFSKADSSSGTYSIKIVGTTVSGKRKEYPTKVFIPELTGVRFAGKHFKVDSIYYAELFSEKKIVLRCASDSLLVWVNMDYALPSTAGIYELGLNKLNGDKASLEIMTDKISGVFTRTYYSKLNEPAKIKVEVGSDGKVIAVTLPYISVEEEISGAIKTISIDVRW